MIERIKAYIQSLETEGIPQLSVNCVIFGFHEKTLKVIVNNIELNGLPGSPSPQSHLSQGLWRDAEHSVTSRKTPGGRAGSPVSGTPGKKILVLPGGYIGQTENLTDAVARIVKESTGLEKILFKQFAVFGDASRSFGKEFEALSKSLGPAGSPFRDPAMKKALNKSLGPAGSPLRDPTGKKTLNKSSAFPAESLASFSAESPVSGTLTDIPLAFTAESPVSGTLTDTDQLFKWFSKRFVSVCYLALVDFNKIELKPTQFLEAAQWLPVDKIKSLAMDHSDMVESARETLIRELPHTPIASNLLPAKFILPELHALAEAVLGRPIDRPNFRRKMLKSDLIVKVGQDASGQRRPADLYKFKYGKKTNLNEEMKFGF